MARSNSASSRSRADRGTVSATIDGLIHDVDLHIQREVVMDIHLHLMAPPGTGLADIRRCPPTPHAGPVPEISGSDVAPSRTPSSQFHGGRSTGARRIGCPGEAAIAPRLAAERYGLVIVAEDVEDHPENQTRFVLVAPTRVPAYKGHDKTSVVCFQRADHPGSLHGISGSSRRATST